MIAVIINNILKLFNLRMVRNTALIRLEHLLATNTAIEEITKQYTLQLQSSLNATLNDNTRLYWRMVDYIDSSRQNVVNRTCPLCEHEGALSTYKVFTARCIFGGGNLTRFKCPECGVIAGPDKMFALDDDELSDEYVAHYRVHSEGDTLWKELDAFYSLNPNKPDRYLNFGSGESGAAMRVLRSDGWNVWSFEPNASHAHQSHPYLITKWDDLKTHSFHGIFSNDVIEHLRHPIRDLQVLRQLLTPEGRWVAASCCFDYLYEYTRFHLYFFVDTSYRILADQAGLNFVALEGSGEYKHLILSVP